MTDDPFSFALPPDAVDALADRIAERVAEKLATAATPEVLTPTQAAERLGLSIHALYKRLRNGDIAYYQDDRGHRIHIPREAIEAYAARVRALSRARRRDR